MSAADELAIVRKLESGLDVLTVGDIWEAAGVIKALYEALDALLNGCTVIAKHSGIDIEAECLAFIDSPFAKARRALAKAGGEQ